MTRKLNTIKARMAKAVEARNMMASTIDTAFQYTIPNRAIYLDPANRVKDNPEIYDSTAIIATQRFVTKLQSMVVPVSQAWMRLVKADAEDSNEQEGLDAETAKFFREIKMSNFDVQIAESFQDLSVSTGALLCNPAPIGSPVCLNFTAVGMDEFFAEAPTDGSIKTVFRKYVIRIEEIEFDYVGARISEEHKKSLETNPNATLELSTATIYDTKTALYTTTIFEAKTDHIFLETTSESSAWIVFREDAVSNNAMGIGRNMRLLPTIKTLNKITELTLQAGSIAVSGTFTAVDDGVLNPYNVRLTAGGVIPVMSNQSNNRSLERLDTPTDFNWAENEKQILKAEINDVLLANPFGSIEQTPVRTATEISARNKELFDVVASSFGRLQIELVAPLIKRVVFLMQEAGKMDDFKLDDVDVSYEFVSPLTRLQQSADIENVLEWLSVVSSMGEEVLGATVNMEKVPAWLGKKYSVPQELIKTDDEQVATVEKQMELDMSVGEVAQTGVASPQMGMEGI